MNRNLLLAGGTVLVVGGLAYWYLSQQGNGNGKPCSQHTTQASCVGAGCYWYNGSCHSTQPPQHGCEGACMYEGQTDCDQAGNLCVCRDGEWELQQLNSPLCVTGEKYYTCLPSVNKIVACVPTVGTVSDRCTDPYFSYGCFCDPPNTLCDEFHFCDERVHRCVEEVVGLNISADNSNWDSCESTPGTGWDESGMRCYFSLGREYCGSTLFGTFGWEWGFPVTNGKLRIYGYLDGVGWTQLGHEIGFDVWGTVGEVSIQQFFPKQGMSHLLFECVGSSFTNLKPKSFYGTLG